MEDKIMTEALNKISKVIELNYSGRDKLNVIRQLVWNALHEYDNIQENKIKELVSIIN